MGGVALLARHLLVVAQPLPDQALPRPDRWGGPLGDLASRRPGRHQRLAHGPAVHAKAPRQGLMPSPSSRLAFLIFSYSSTLFISFSLALWVLGTTQRRDSPVLGVGPFQVIEMAPSGAISGCQTHL